MRFLLDTHALLWWFTNDPRLSSEARLRIVDVANEILVSAASAWEIATKQRLGKLEGVPTAARRFAELVEADGFTPLSIAHAHALRAGSFAADHRDPFDRMIAAQAEIEEVPLVTCDLVFKEFGIETVW